MNGFYQFTTKIKDALKLDPFVKTVTYGDIFQVDLNKQTIFPLSHLVVNNVTKESNVMRFNISILAMDIVNISKDVTTDIFIGNDNTHDIWNTQLKVLDRLTELLRRGSIVSDGYQLDGNPTFEQFTERFENYLAGWTVTFDVIVGNDMTICEVGSSGGTCSPAGYLIKDSAGTTLYNGTIASGATETQVIQDSNYLVEYVNGTLIESGSILAEGSVTVQVPNPVTCEDATVNVNGAFWDSVPSGGTENVIVRQSSGSTQVGSIQGQYFRIANSTAVLKTTGGTTISTTSIKAEASENIVAPNTTIEVNGTTEGTVVAGATVDIQLSNPSGTVTPTSVTQVGNDLQVVLPAPTYASARLLKTGQTTSYRTGDDGDLEAGRNVSFTTLLANNPFGNNNRFTDELGTQTYTKNIVLDWTTFDGVSVLGYKRTVTTISSGGWNNAIATCAATSIPPYTTGWRLANVNEWHNIINRELASPLGYAPFTAFVFSSTSHTSTTYKPVPSVYSWGISTVGSTFAKDKTEGASCLAVRTFTVSGTTIT
jgi:hypothetical protein